MTDLDFISIGIGAGSSKSSNEFLSISSSYFFGGTAFSLALPSFFDWILGACAAAFTVFVLRAAFFVDLLENIFIQGDF